ncbi:MAG: hypothetical protein HY343_01210, partial [Lentisphaerae bacterium]|nr:hypothetical protein [Lentisphaerota bacterium]
MRISRPWRWGLLTVSAFVAALVLLGMLHTGGHWLRPAWMTPLLWLLPLFWLTWRWRPPSDAKGNAPGVRRALPLLILSVGLFLSLFSSLVDFRWFYWVDWLPGEPGFLSGGLNTGIFLTALLVPLCASGRLKATWMVFVIFLVVEGLCWKSLVDFTGGQALYRDDHASMMFRLWEFTRTFPQLLNYDPFWNAGVVHYVTLTSGLNALGLMFWPFWSSFPIDQVYTPLLGVSFLVVMPLIGVLSVRLMGGNWTAGWCSAILLLGVNRMFFLWLLHYGTVASLFCTGFFLPLSACVFRVLWLNRRSWRLAILLTAVGLMLILWPQGILPAAAVVVGVLSNPRRWTWRKAGFLALCALGVMALYYRAIGILLFQSNELFQQLLRVPAQPVPPAASAGDAGLILTVSKDMLKEGWMALRCILQDMNPMLVFLGLGGVWVLRVRSLRTWLSPTMVILAVIAAWGPIWKPAMQLQRLVIPLAMLAVIPASWSIARVLKTTTPAWALPRAALLALLILTGWNVARLYGGTGPAPATVLSEKTWSLVRLIRNETPEGGRVLFAGQTVHYYGDNGHVAMLPALAGREMMACDYFHFPPKSVEYNYPPAVFRKKGDERMFDF